RRMGPEERSASARRSRPVPPSHDQHGFDVGLEWGRRGVEALAGIAEVVVIVDVLSFSTAVSVALERGATVIPHPIPDESSASERANALGATLANPARSGPGPTLSPSSLATLRAGETLLLPSPNGATLSVLAERTGAIVLLGCLRNATAVGAHAAKCGRPVAVIPAGEVWPDGSLRPSVEDLIGAGAVIAAMGAAAISPEARAAVAAFHAAMDDLPATLLASVSGRELAEAGFAADVRLAATLDATSIVPVMRDGRFRG
ncbi:MAG TPA: 2-phosphosulfolactate phosphatase, partial [Candidatus Limnocylindrales bacterium]